MEANATDSGDRPTLYVGIGASAGGIEACEALFAAMPADTGAAFMLVLHLDPTRASRVAEVLQRHTRLTISQADHTAPLAPNHLYVIAPGTRIRLADDTLEVERIPPDQKRRGLADDLLSSLAEASGPRAVGVILSGAGNDGTEGLRRIRAAGGLSLVQEPRTARSTGMLQSAIDAGIADAVLAPDAIARAVAEFARGGARPSPVDPEHARQEPDDDEAEHSPPCQPVFEELGAAYGVDFGDYKTGTLERRARRRMMMSGIEDWADYAARLADDDEERYALYQDVLIGVTDFFRDADVWERLAAELPALLEQRGAPGVRAWTLGCGTGEEAYTLAMLLCDHVSSKSRHQIQIYATDLNERALALARRGVYTTDALENVPERFRDHCFNHRDDHVQIDRRIRDWVTFAPHNALRDPPFSNMDVVLCRNLLIYLRPEAHDRLLRRLHFALRPGGLLVLGRAETPGRQTQLFEEFSKNLRIFRSRAVPARERFHVEPRILDRRREGPAPVAFPDSTPRSRDQAAPERRIERYVLRVHAPACVAIGADDEIQFFYGPTQRYLVPPTGESRRDLLAWIRPGFYIQLRSALIQARASGESLAADGQIDRDGEVFRVRCTIEPIPASVVAEKMLLVTFRDTAPSALWQTDAADNEEPLVREIEQELLDTRRELQSTVEQLDAVGAEHRAGHEELLSLNEELQSSNEELEASKEELEALNEEMNTINRELEEKNAELRAANSDLDNLFLSTGIPTLFLDRELKVRRFTDAAADIMRIVPSDIGRPIDHIRERFENGRTADRCRYVLESLEADAAEVWTEAGRYYVRNIAPYRADDKIDGICITFSEVTEQKRAIQASEAARTYSDAIIDSVRTPLLVLNRALAVVSANPAFEAAFGAGSRVVGRPISELRHAWNTSTLEEALSSLLSQDRAVNDLEITKEHHAMLVNARRVRLEDADDRIVLSFEDVTQQRESQQQSERHAEQLHRDARRKDQWIAMLGHELRNPLGAIVNGVELLKLAPPERRAQTIDMIERQTSQIGRLLDDLLDAARIISGKLDIERKHVDLAEECERSLASVQRLLESRQHNVSVTLPPAGTVWVRGDPVRLSEIFTNLLTNAAKYTPPGGHVTLELAADDGTVTVSVRDTGVGIADDLKPHIFEIFTQGPRSLDRADSGLGLGLPLVQTLVRLHGGAVEVLSDGEDRGSEFRVALPRARAPADYRPEHAADEGGAVPRQRILVVDDDKDTVDSLAELLVARGHDARAVGGAVEAVEQARELEPDIALLDLGLPGMDGYELARRLRKQQPDLVLIAVTGYTRDPEKLDAAGFNDHLIKPIDSGRLAALLNGAPKSARAKP